MAITKLQKAKKVAVKLFFFSCCTLVMTLLACCIAQNNTNKEIAKDTGFLTGKILVKRDSTPLPFGKVYIEKLKDTILVGEDGGYTCILPKGRYKIIGSSLGFEAQRIKITLKGRDTVQVDFYLNEKQEWLH